MWTSFKRSRFSGKGFTLIELLVVLAIITIITAVFLLQQRRFDSSTLLRSLAYSVALSLRQAQVYGTSVRQFGSSFNYSYGIYFSGDSSYILFADVNNDNQYTSSPDEKVDLFTLSGGYTINQFCAVRSGGEEDCLGGGKNGGTGITWLSIYFKRPNPDAQIKTSAGNAYQSAYIKVAGPQDVLARQINVTLTGQISVNTSTVGL
jgi:prepilin-type N-terminal cleavage/methylation domain-containing protein